MSYVHNPEPLFPLEQGSLARESTKTDHCFRPFIKALRHVPGATTAGIRTP
jgi:hypothetical protein